MGVFRIISKALEGYYSSHLFLYLLLANAWQEPNEQDKAHGREAVLQLIFFFARTQNVKSLLAFIQNAIPKEDVNLFPHVLRSKALNLLGRASAMDDMWDLLIVPFSSQYLATYLQQLRDSGVQITPVALNFLIQGYGHHKNLHLVKETYDSFPDFGLSPSYFIFMLRDSHPFSVETYQALFLAAKKSGNLSFAKEMLEEMEHRLKESDVELRFGYLEYLMTFLDFKPTTEQVIETIELLRSKLAARNEKLTFFSYVSTMTIFAEVCLPR